MVGVIIAIVIGAMCLLFIHASGAKTDEEQMLEDMEQMKYLNELRKRKEGGKNGRNKGRLRKKIEKSN